MKKTKKIVSGLLAAAMVLTMAAPAMAAPTEDKGNDGTFTITIDNPNQGHVYEAYQIFSGKLAHEGEDEDAVYYLSDVEWGSNVNEEDIQAYMEVTSAAAAAEKLEKFQDNSQDIDNFAKEIEKYLIGDPFTTVGDDYTMQVPVGYYLIKDKTEGTELGEGDAYSKFIVKVVGNVKPKPKSSVPTVTKKIVENSQEKDAADYNIGDWVTFKLTGTMPNTLGDYESYKYVFHDTLSNGLTYDEDNAENSVKVYLDKEEDGNDITEKFDIAFANQKLTISIDDVNEIGDVKADSKIIVVYKAQLNAEAEIGTTGNENEVYLEYSNNPNGDGTGETKTDKVIVFTFELDVTKVDGNTYDEDTEDYKTKLPNVKFNLYKVDNGSNKYVTVDTAGKVSGWVDDETNASVLMSNADGKFIVRGLDAGTYYLVEKETVAGYNKLTGPIKLVIDSTISEDEYNGENNLLNGLTIKVDDSDEAQNATDGENNGIVETIVKNNKGAVLPETGGIGTTIFYVLGTVLILGAGVLLITKKKVGSRN